MSKNIIDEIQMASMIDHTLLKKDANKNEIEKVCDEAKRYGFCMVAVNQYMTNLCSKLLKGSSVKVGAAISFPFGQTTIESKVFETENAIDNGADEIDYVINISKVKDGDYYYVKKEMNEIVNICRENNVISKVIFETSQLTKKEIIELCKISSIVKPDYIKTSTGFTEEGATKEDIILMRTNTSPSVKIKASGGIRNLTDAMEMIESGASRIGTSSGVQIIEELRVLSKNMLE